MKRALKYCWFHFVMLSTAWLPDFTFVLRVRGFLAKPAFERCGRNLQIAKHTEVCFSSRIVVGDDVFMGRATWIHASEGMTIGDGVQFAPFSVAITGNHGKSRGSYRFGHGLRGPIVIGAGSWIATHAVITACCRIGEGVLVAANSVVTKDVPDHCIVGGVPARVIRENVGDDEPNSRRS